MLIVAVLVAAMWMGNSRGFNGNIARQVVKRGRHTCNFIRCKLHEKLARFSWSIGLKLVGTRERGRDNGCNRFALIISFNLCPH